MTETQLHAGDMFADDLDVLGWYIQPAKYPFVMAQFRLKLVVGSIRVEVLPHLTPDRLDPVYCEGFCVRPCGEGEGELWLACAHVTAFSPDYPSGEWRFSYYQDSEGVLPVLVRHPDMEPLDSLEPGTMPEAVNWGDMVVEAKARWQRHGVATRQSKRRVPL